MPEICELLFTFALIGVTIKILLLYQKRLWILNHVETVKDSRDSFKLV